MRKLILIAINGIALFLMSSNNIRQALTGLVIVLGCYVFLLFAYIHTPKENYQLTKILLRPAPKSNYKWERIITYEVEEGVLTEETWKKLKEVLNSFALEFLHVNFPNVKWDSQFYLMRYSEYSAGQFINIGFYENLLMAEKPTSPIILNEAIVYAVIKFDDFGIIRPIVEHELVHYALWKEGKKFQDHAEDFENKLEELNIRSNDADKSQVYSFGIDRVVTKNGFKDILCLAIPPSKQSNKEEYENIIKEYKVKYFLKTNNEE